MTHNTTTLKSSKVSKNVTTTNEILTTHIFCTANLWHIQKQVKTAYARRRSF